MTDLATRSLTKAEATDLTERIRESAEATWSLLVEAHDGRAWSVLGYDSWRAYATTEFGMSQSHAYRLLDQARVVNAIEDATGSPMGEITERDARAIKPVLSEVTDHLRNISDEMTKDEVVAELKKVVGDIKARQADELAEQRARFAEWAKDNQKPFVPTRPCPACDGSGQIRGDT